MVFCVYTGIRYYILYNIPIKPTCFYQENLSEKYFVIVFINLQTFINTMSRLELSAKSINVSNLILNFIDLSWKSQIKKIDFKISSLFDRKNV